MKTATTGSAGKTARDQITARDLQVLRLIAEQCTITQAQLARLIGRTEHTARSLRARWRRAGWTESGVLLVGCPPFIWLTAKGQRACGVDYKPWRPAALGRLPHLVACSDARLVVEERRPDAVWTSERELLRTARITGAPRTEHMPDACVAVDGGLVAVEVELTAKDSARTERIARELLARYDAVWYFATGGARTKLDALAKRAGFERIQVLELSNAGTGR
jgi:DNA-binding CsgD family transcriptional regulator